MFKTDHPDGFYNQGHLLNPHKKEFLDRQRARVYTSWEPPVGGEKREVKKIIATNRPVNDGHAEKEFD